jgi:DNA modification methylase
MGGKMRVETIGEATLIHGDCMEYMATLPDKAFDLAIVDPPYGIGAGKMNLGKWGSSRLASKEWDYKAPCEGYFSKLFRISKNQIIFGGNYFCLPPSRCFIVWDKGAGMRERSYAECEMAWASFDENAAMFSHDPLANGDYRGKIHPTQKPVALYKWLLSRYAKPGDRILDTHGGSGSSVIACIDSGFPIVWIEKDADYYEAALKRIKDFAAQPRLFEDEKPEPVQGDLGLTPSP